MPRRRSGQISVEALAPRARLWELVLNDLNDGFVEVLGVCHEGTLPGNMLRQEVGQDICHGRNLGREVIVAS
ncbi:hypothetical protein V6N11_081382 [Hibiscus sabdariffa]|uniref:Uncharacterized protein n=1 Tax=Hibiscus sabdariffa TaxID=183260 RepID=A0ABR2QJN7_9ROSI